MSKNMYHSPNLSCPLSNGTTIINLLGVMETDFLNFHDEEHFSTGLYQSELLDDSQSSLLDIVGDDYNRHASTDYTDHSIIWEQDVERELNGDVAVIPMSSQMDSFPKLSSSPPAKDFHKMYSDWQHLAPIETTPSEVIDMLDCFTPNILLVPCKSPEPTAVLPNFDFSQTKIPKTEPNRSTSPILNKTEQLPVKVVPEVLPPKAVRKTGGKNLELLKQVVKEEIDLDNSFKSEITSSDELEGLNDNFDITSYVNGEDDFGKSKGKAEMIKKEENGFGGRKFGGCYEKTMHLEDECEEDDEEEEESEASEPEEEAVEIVEKVEKHEDSEDDCCIDVETVSEQMPVLQARDVNSLWEQFEANEAANPQLPQNIFEESTKSPLSTDTPMETLPIPQPNCKLNIQNENKSKIKQVNPELKQPTGGTNASKPLPETLSLELIQKMKASSAKKAISVIPAMPKKPRGSYSNHRSNKLVLKANNESIQLDHDYCSTSGSTGSSPRKNSTTESQSPEHHLRSNNLGLRKYKCDKTQIASDNSVNNEVKKSTGTTGTVIDDTAIRIGQQIKNAINNENAMLKQKYIKCRTQEFLKNQSTVKNMDGKVMISLLKPNIRNNICVKSPAIIKIEDKTVINKSTEEFHPTQQMCKKRKLNLEEYKRLRGDLIIKPNNNNNNNSTDNSINNSPRHSPKLDQNEKYQELIMKMSNDILKTPAKSKEGEKCVPITQLEEFIPPDAKKQSIQQEEIKIKNNEPEAVKTIKSNTKVNLAPVTTTGPNTHITAKQKTYKIRTIVSIGTNTDESFLLKNNHHSVSTTKPPEPQRIAFKLQKRNREIIQQRNKFFDTKSSESEDSLSPKKKETTSNIVNKSKLSEIITPILQNTNPKINSNSLITNINATLLQKSPVKVDPIQQTEEHGEDKTVIILNKSDEKPVLRTVGVQTDPEVVQEKEEKIKENTQVRQYRARRDSSTTSSSTSLSSEIVRTNKTTAQRQQQHHKLSHRTSSSNSLSSSGCSRWSRSRSRSRSHSRSRSRSRSQSSTGSDYSHSSSYSSGSSRSRSRSRSISPVRRWPDRNSRSRQRYSRSRRRSRSSSYRNGYSRTYSRSRSRLRREREQAERERMREVEERRVIYVGKISHDITKADLRRRFQSFGPITNVSVHFRDHGDNYGFVTFQHKMDAYEAVERGNDDPNVPKYDISFGGRRAFCKTRYSDLDNIEDDSFNTSAIFRREGDSFDILLREVQAKLRKRKV